MENILFDIKGILIDQFVSLENIKHDDATNKLVIKFRTTKNQTPKRINTNRFFKKYRLETYIAYLTFGGVISFEINDSRGLDEYRVEDISMNGNLLQVISYSSVVASINLVDNFTYSTEETPTLGRPIMISTIFGIESSK